MKHILHVREAHRGVNRHDLVAAYDFVQGVDPQTLYDVSRNGHNGTLGSTAGGDTNDPAWGTGGIGLVYDGVDDEVTGLPTAAGISTLMGDGVQASGFVRGKRKNVQGTVYYETRHSRKLTPFEAARQRHYLNGIHSRRGFTGVKYQHAYPIPCAAGLMDFSITNGKDVLWVFPDGSTSTASRPAKTLASAGTVWLYCSNWDAPNLSINCNTTESRYLGALSELPPVTYLLSLYNCSLVTGTLADLPPLTYYLSLYNCSLVTGALLDLPPVTNYLDLGNCSLVTGALLDLPPVTYYLSLYNCSLVTGALLDLPPLTYYLSLTNCSQVTGALADLPPVTYLLSLTNCSQVTGVLTPTASIKYVYLSGTGMSADDTNTTIHNLATQNTQTYGTLTTNGTRTSASDADVATLRARHWTVDGS